MNLFFLFIISGLMIAILTHPTVSVAGAASGLLAWFNSVLPSLFPFMVLTGLLIHTGTFEALSKKISHHVPLLKKLPITAIFAVITGLLCGYPMGIRTVSQLKESGQLNDRQTHLLYSFVNQPGPMFVLGYALPLSGLTSGQESMFLTAFYGGVGITALLSTLSTKLIRPPSVENIKPAQSAPSNVDSNDFGFLSLFESVLMSSMTTLAKIGGYMMLFSLIAAIIGEYFPTEPTLCLMLSGIMEMTTGLSLAPMVGNRLSPYFVLGFVSFGGLSVAAQSFSTGTLSPIDQIKYLFWKLIQTIVTVLLFYSIQNGYIVLP